MWKLPTGILLFSWGLLIANFSAGTRGEVERLVRHFKENQRLLASIPSKYEITYLSQVHSHHKQGISTLDSNANKSNEHLHHTSFYIKAFEQKLRLDLELNQHLLPTGVVLKRYVKDNREIISMDLENCYYQGLVKDYPESSVAVSTCQGMSGVIHLSNTTYIIHPFVGGDMTKRHPHVIYEATAKKKTTCGNSGMHEWGFANFRKHHRNRIRRDVRLETKFVELAVVCDHELYKQLHYNNDAAAKYALQVVNIVDLYFKSLNTKLGLVYLELWLFEDQMTVSSDVRQTLLNFMEYSSHRLYKINKDSTQFITARGFRGNEVGMAIPDSVCTAKSVGVNEDSNVLEPQHIASTIAHIIGHNLGMSHDDNRDCDCSDFNGCIMTQNNNVEEILPPQHFSSCSEQDYISALRIGHGVCLFNHPNKVTHFRTCGNGFVEEWEQCDCGTIEECAYIDPCCDPITCKLKSEADCSTGPCCENCKLKEAGHLCRPPLTECDIPEFCDGISGQCALNIYKKNGNICDQDHGYCFEGTCSTQGFQCQYIWGSGAAMADLQCFERFNPQGSLNGNCGVDLNGKYIKCEHEHILCGSLQCQKGSLSPLVPGLDHTFARTIMSIGGREFECKVTSGSVAAGILDMGLVRDGSKCGQNKICINQTCVSLTPYIDNTRCPSNNIALTCSGHGVCSSVNNCYCDRGWTSHDCSMKDNSNRTIYVYIPTTQRPHTTTSAYEVLPVRAFVEPTMQGFTKVIAGRNGGAVITPVVDDKMGTTVMVLILASVVCAVVVILAFVALCYRRRSTASPWMVAKQRKAEIILNSRLDKSKDNCSVENVNRIIKFGSMPSYREDKLLEMKNRKKLLRIKGSNVDDLYGPEVEVEVLPPIEISPNDLSKVPEKGILKKVTKSPSECEKLSDEMRSQSDNNLDMLSQSDNQEHEQDLLTELERNLKSLDGYHEDYLEEALRGAASYRSSQTNLSDEFRNSLLDELPEFCTGIFKGSTEHIVDSQEQIEETVQPCAPVRIHHINDLLKELGRRTNSYADSYSEDTRIAGSETEADHHVRSIPARGGSHTESQREDDSCRYAYNNHYEYQQPIRPVETSDYGNQVNMDQDEEEDEDDEEEDDDEFPQPMNVLELACHLDHSEESSESSEYDQRGARAIRPRVDDPFTRQPKMDYSFERSINLNTPQQEKRASYGPFLNKPFDFETHLENLYENKLNHRRPLSLTTHSSDKSDEMYMYEHMPNI